MSKQMDLEYEAVVLVTRGDEMPKKNYEKKLHPTYETSIRIKNAETSPHVVIKFFDQYRNLFNDLTKEGVGSAAIPIEAMFPPSQKTSVLGIPMSEEALQQRCYLLNKWMNALFASYVVFPPEAQKILSDFLSLNDDDVSEERNKELILELIQRRRSDGASANRSATPINSPTAAAVVTTSNNPAATGNDAAPSKPVLASANSTQPPSEQLRRRQSVLGDVSLTLSELTQFSKACPFCPYLTVKVSSGEMIPKREGDSKLHRSYETVVRVIPYEELASRQEIDYESYRVHQAIPSVRVLKTFDSYMKLRDTLEEHGVYSSDVAAASTNKNSRVLDAVFPKSYAKSSMGMHLTDSQYIQRIALLNTWFGALMRMYSSLTESVKMTIQTWLGVGHSIKNEAQYEVFQKMLNNRFEPVQKITAQTAREQNDSSTQASGNRFNMFGNNKQQSQPIAGPQSNLVVDEIKNTPVIKSTPPKETNASTISNATSTASPPAVQKGSVDDNVPSSRGRGSIGSVAGLGPRELENLGQETIVHSFLGVHVIMGEMMAKKDGDGKVHHAYETKIRILEIYEVEGFDQSTIDADAYARFSKMQQKSVTKVFDGYRTLKQNLQVAHVYSRDTASEASKDSKAIIVDSLFPKTYPKSKLGIGLTESQLITRTAVLNSWMGTLMQHFHAISPEAQDLIINFLSMEEDNPAEPQNRVMQAILENTFKVPVKKVGTSNGLSFSSKSKGGKSQQVVSTTGDSATLGTDQEGNAQSNDNSAQPAGLNKGCGCTIM